MVLDTSLFNTQHDNVSIQGKVETWVQSQVESCQRHKKWYLIPPCLTQHYKVCIKGKVEQSRGRSSFPPTPRCSKLLKREPSGHPQLQSPTLLTNLYINRVSRVFANGLGDQASIPVRVIPKIQIMVLDTSLLNTQHNKLRIKGKVKQSKERISILHYTLVL